MAVVKVQRGRSQTFSVAVVKVQRMAVVKVQHGSSKGLAWQYVKFCAAAACVQETIPDMFWPRQRVNNLIEKPSKLKKTL